MAKAKAFDVWFVTANTVYKQVPYRVVSDWVQSGRLASSDQLRPAGSSDAWKRVDAFELFADYLPRRVGESVPSEPETPRSTEPGSASTQYPVEHAEVPEVDVRPRRRTVDGDDDVDMIPLIDISMVLLVFFIMMKVTNALAPVDVPAMRYTGEPSTNPRALTITIDGVAGEEPMYTVRVGNQAPAPENDKLRDEAGRRRIPDAVKELLKDAPTPRIVRIACNQKLESRRMTEVITRLQPLERDGTITVLETTVQEAPQK